MYKKVEPFYLSKIGFDSYQLPVWDSLRNGYKSRSLEITREDVEMFNEQFAILLNKNRIEKTDKCSLAINFEATPNVGGEKYIGWVIIHRDQSLLAMYFPNKSDITEDEFNLIVLSSMF